MKTVNSMQLKALINNKAKQLNVSSQLVMQNYVLERVLERIAKSKYRDSFVVKGGFLLSSIIGLGTRTTMDLDTTVKNLVVSPSELQVTLQEIIRLECDDNLSFELSRIEEVREGSEHPGYRVSLKARFEQIAIPFSIDISVGDIITPEPVIHGFSRLFDKGAYYLYSYPIETVLAEKLETVLSRSIANTRARDYFDIYILDRLKSEDIDYIILHQALLSTTTQRNTGHILMVYDRIIALVRADNSLRLLWETYTKKNSYASGITFGEACDSIINHMERAGFKCRN